MAHRAARCPRPAALLVPPVIYLIEHFRPQFGAGAVSSKPGQVYAAMIASCLPAASNFCIVTDTLTRAERSARMALVRGRGTKPERRLEKLVRAALGSRVRMLFHPSAIRGRPDVAIRSLRVVIFAHGCFWHKCPTHGRTPKSRLDFWTQKLDANARRDRRLARALRAQGLGGMDDLGARPEPIALGNVPRAGWSRGLRADARCSPRVAPSRTRLRVAATHRACNLLADTWYRDM